ncbi:MlaD family protein [Flavobacteriales bacterium]|nr:MlaD family protein [Flavobacteriales bacterium]
MSKGKEIKIGLVVISSIAILVFGANFLSGDGNPFAPKNIYYAVYKNISGLSENNNIVLHGLQVGKIRSIELLPTADNSEIIVSFVIDNPSVKIPIGSQAQIESLDLLGTKVIALQFNDTLAFHVPGDTIRGDIEQDLEDQVSAQLAPLKDKTDELLGSIDSAVTIVQTILNKDARENLSASFQSIKRAIETFETVALRLDTMVADEQVRLSGILINIESITGNVKRSNEDITNILANFESISDTLAKANIAQTVLSANSALSEVSDVFEKVNAGEGTLGMLVHNDTLYEHVEAAAKDLDLLLWDMKAHPERYVHVSVFGKRNKGDLDFLSKEERAVLQKILEEQKKNGDK